MDKYSDIYQERANKAQKLKKRQDDERDRAVKKVFLNKEIKSEIDNAKKLRQEIASLEESNLGINSNSYKKAYKEYVKKFGEGEEADYGFDHYEWREGSPAYDAAYKEFKTKNKQLLGSYDKIVSGIGKKIYGEFSNEKVKNGLDMTYADFGRMATEQIIRFGRF